MNPWTFVDPLGLEGCEATLDFETAKRQLGPRTLQAIKMAQVPDPTGGELLRHMLAGHGLDGSQDAYDLQNRQKAQVNGLISATNTAGVVANEVAIAVASEVATAGIAPAAEIGAARIAENAGDLVSAAMQARRVRQAEQAGLLAGTLGKGRKIALGLWDEGNIPSFAKRHGAITWQDLSRQNPSAWKTDVFAFLSDPHNTAAFNLDGIDDCMQSVYRSASGRGGATDLELRWIYENPDWHKRITFYKDGEVVEIPFRR